MAKPNFTTSGWRKQNPQPKEKVNTTLYWKKRLGLGDEVYEERKQAVLQMIRKKWPRREQLSRSNDQRSDQVKSLLENYVASFKDSERYVKEPGPGEPFEKQLRLYTEWALLMNSWSKDEMKGWNQRNIDGVSSDAKPRADGNDLTSSFHDQEDDHAEQGNELAVKEEEIVPGSTRHTPLYLSQTPPPSSPPLPAVSNDPPSRSKLDWDAVEVNINADVFDLGTIWLPMANLKPDQKPQCTWHEFELKDLKRQFELETEASLDTDQYEWVYLAEHREFSFNRTGGYRIALKRFAEAGGSLDNVLHLQIQPRKPTLAPSTDAPPAKRARSRFSGANSDYSDDGSAQENSPQKRQSAELLQQSQQIAPGQRTPDGASDCTTHAKSTTVVQVADDSEMSAHRLRIGRLRSRVKVVKNELDNCRTKLAEKTRAGLDATWHRSRIPGHEKQLAELEAQLRRMEERRV